MLTMRDWMFIKQYAGLREYVLGNFDLRGLGDFAVGAFDEVPNDVLSVTVSVLHHSPHRPESSIAHQPTPPEGISTTARSTWRSVPPPCATRRSGPSTRQRSPNLCHSCHDPYRRARIAPQPIFRFPQAWRSRSSAHRIGDRKGSPFLRSPWEIERSEATIPAKGDHWVPYIKGGRDTTWCEPMSWVLNWSDNGLEDKIRHESIDGVHSRSVRGPKRVEILRAGRIVLLDRINPASPTPLLP